MYVVYIMQYMIYIIGIQIDKMFGGDISYPTIKLKNTRA